MSQDHAYALPADYMLEEYRIERMLGSGVWDNLFGA